MTNKSKNSIILAPNLIKVNLDANAFSQFFYVRYQFPNDTVWRNFYKIIRRHKPNYSLLEKNIWQLLNLECVLVLGYILNRCNGCQSAKDFEGSKLLDTIRGRMINFHEFNDIEFDKNVDKSLDLEFMHYDANSKKYIPLFRYQL